MLTVFIDYKGVVYHDFLLQSQTNNNEYYLGILRRLRAAETGFADKQLVDLATW